MAVPYTFAGATSSIPLSQLDSNFATTITLGNTAIQLGNTVSTLNNMTMANVTISSVSTPITAAQGGTGLTNPGASGNVLTSNGTVWLSQAPSYANLTLSNVTISSVSTPITVPQTAVWNGSTTLTKSYLGSTTLLSSSTGFRVVGISFTSQMPNNTVSIWV